MTSSGEPYKCNNVDNSLKPQNESSLHCSLHLLHQMFHI